VTPNQPNRADISVIIPAFHAEATIRRALESVAAQTLKPSEIIVVDDGSEDGTFEAAEACRAKMQGIEFKLFRQTNRGAGAARNKALTEARCAIVAFLDADDEWLSEKLKISLDHLQSENHVLVAHNGWIIEGGQETYLDIAARYQAASDALYHGLYRRGFISTSSVIARRAAVMEAGCFDEGLLIGQDFDLWLKILAIPGATFQVLDKPLTRYHITPGSITSLTRRRLVSTLKSAARHAPALRQHPGSPLVSLWFRVAAVHLEAVRAYIKDGKSLLSLWTLILTPLNTIKYSYFMYFSTQKPSQSEPELHKLRIFDVVLGAWFVAVMAAYLYQFRGLIDPILRLLGIR